MANAPREIIDAPSGGSDHFDRVDEQSSHLPSDRIASIVALIVAILGFVYCSWQAMDVLSVWAGTSSEGPGFFLFLTWLFCGVLLKAVARTTLRFSWAPLVAGVALAFLGEISTLNCVQHLGFIVAVGSLVNGNRYQYLWLVSGVLTLPVCGWAFEVVGIQWHLVARWLGLVIVGLLLGGHELFSNQVRSAVAGLATLLLLAFLPHVSSAGTLRYNSVQSPARPMGLDVVDLVATRKQDTQSRDFQKNYYPEMEALVNRHLGERYNTHDREANDGLVALDASKLTLNYAADVRTYFVGEGAGYHNSLGFNTGGGGVDTGDPLLIFPDASSPISYLGSGNSRRSIDEPLFPGDFVELGSFNAGEHLDFFLISNGANGGSNVYSTDSSVNPDGINHVVAFAEVNNPYLMIGFEDLYGGGDNDFNDLVLAIYFGQQNIDYIIENAAMYGSPVPESDLAWLAVFAILGFIVYRQRKKKASQASEPEPATIPSRWIPRPASLARVRRRHRVCR